MHVIFNKCIKYCTFNIHNFSKNAQTYIDLTYTFLNESTKFYIFNLYKFSKNITNFVHSNTHTHTTQLGLSM